MNAALIGWWSDILRRVPDSTMFIGNTEMSHTDHQQALERQFVEQGVDRARLRLEGTGTRRGVVASYADVHIVLEHGLGNASLFTRQFEDLLVAMRMRAGRATKRQIDDSEGKKWNNC